MVEAVDRIDEEHLNLYSIVAKELATALSGITNNDFSVPEDKAQDIRDAVRVAMSKIDRRIIFAKYLINGSFQNAMLVDFDPQGNWRWVLTEGGILEKLASNKREPVMAVAADWIELSGKFPESLQFEVGLSQAQGGRIRDLY